MLVVGIAVFAASNARLTPIRLGLAAFVMGSGICTMHYLGMYALHDSLNMRHDPAYVFASFLVAFNAAGLAIWLLFGFGRRPPILISASVLALAISAMHYTAMTGMTYELVASADIGQAPVFCPGMLAIVVSCVAFLVSGLFLLALVPAQDAASHERVAENSADAPVGAEPDNHQPGDEVSNAQMSETEPARKAATGLQAAARPVRAAANATKRTLPIECDGQKGQIGVPDIFAIHADAHYTRLYDGNREFFCPLSISEAEQQLDPKVFSRVHRSHIVNLHQVSQLQPLWRRWCADSGG